MVPQRRFLSGKPGWVRSSAWIWLFSSTENTSAPRLRRGRPVGRIEVEADNVLHLLGEPLVVRQFERLHPVRPEFVRLPNALHASVAEAGGRGHFSAAPV